MAYGAGYPSVCGAGIEAASPGYGTAVAMTDRIPVESESLSQAIKMIEDQTLRGLAGHDVLDLGDISIEGSIKTDLRYTLKSGSYFCGVDLLLSAAMGAAPVINSSITTLLHAANPTRPVTIAFDKQVAYWEFISSMLKGFTLDMKAGEAVKCEFPLIAHRLIRTGTTNGSAQFAALAANGGKRVLFSDLTFRLGDLSDALAAGDAIGLSECKFEFDGNMTPPTFCSPDYATTVGAGTHGDNTTTHSPRLTLKPVRNGKKKVKLSFTAPRYIADTLNTWLEAKTALQFDAKSSIDTAARTFSLLCPLVYLTKVDIPIEGEQATQVKVEAVCMMNGGTTTAASGTNDYMTTSIPTTNNIPDEFAIEMKNSADGRTAAIWS